MEVARRAEDDRLVVGDALLFVCPLAGELEGGLHGLRTSVHGEYHVVAKHVGDLLREPAEYRVVEGARRQGKLLCLLNEGGDDPGVAMTLRHGCGQLTRISEFEERAYAPG